MYRVQVDRLDGPKGNDGDLTEWNVVLAHEGFMHNGSFKHHFTLKMIFPRLQPLGAAGFLNHIDTAASIGLLMNLIKSNHDRTAQMCSNPDRYT